MQLYRDGMWSQGFGVFTTHGMSIDAFLSWKHTFSVPFYVLPLFILYRMIRRPADDPDRVLSQ
ncbi:hypothetical protein Poly21_13750 [Allorhodopirellula heiligendammensis]|uniref:Uncharacterized protein n=1 Tax=Allorhodopirellula heiligendammensis TaxID=2714739 RepID=A0A5C6C7B1_9BACT|nr:hypothetical protein Poly21_13750 [Allorhodopirellula heiligendammensis]